MITQVGYSIRPATEKDRFQLVSLIQLEPYVHRHLDWRAPIDWLGKKPYYVAEKDGQLVAALACPADPPGVSWIRTFACSGSVNTWPYWKQLWAAAREELSTGNVVNIEVDSFFLEERESNFQKSIGGTAPLEHNRSIASSLRTSQSIDTGCGI